LLLHAGSVSILALGFLVFPACGETPAGDPLPSWNDAVARRAIVSFVGRVTDERSPDYVPPARRVATFDHDGCLWAEQPVYFQFIFACDRVRDLAADHPEWRSREPFKSVLEGDLARLGSLDKASLAEIVEASHTGLTTDEFAEEVRAWLRKARHPVTGKRYDAMVYAPMLELLDYLRASGFKTFIVSGGGIDFLRVFAEEVYGIPPEQVVGSSVASEYRVVDGSPVIVKTPGLLFVDDHAGKPVGIDRHIGRRPIFAAGNSDGDFEMLEYTSAGEGPRLALLVHHTDAEREWAYDRTSHVGRLDRVLTEAAARGWVVVDMKRDWKRIWPAE
jgi:phosphoglycolate phosphatase-like HAD superfamily hydrolase